jgi:DNA-binding phage protein
MAKLKTTRRDSADHLKTDGDILLHLEACLEENDPALIAHAIKTIAHARGREEQRTHIKGY